jgi:tRNA(Arg) A34 adenosine deaminase TadA
MQNVLMSRAIDLAVKNVGEGAGGPFAALVVKSGHIVAEGTNLVTSENDPTAHAEMVAIRRASRFLRTFRLSGCDLYTTCEPCPMCLGAIYWARLDVVYYADTREDAAAAGFDDSFIYDQLRQPVTKRTIRMVQVMHEQALVPFKLWASKANKIKY